MRHFTLLAGIGLLAASFGCAAPARFIEKSDTGGIVAVPDYAHREQGVAFIKREIGPNFHIVDEKPVPLGTDTTTVTVAGTGSLLTRMESFFTGTKEVAKTETKTVQQQEWRITYVKTTPPPAAATTTSAASATSSTASPAAIPPSKP